QAIGDIPIALNDARADWLVYGRRRHWLNHAGQGNWAQHETAARPVVPAHPKNGECVGVCIDGPDVKIDRATLIDAGPRSVALDFGIGIVSRIEDIVSGHCRWMGEL